MGVVVKVSRLGFFSLPMALETVGLFAGMLLSLHTPLRRPQWRGHLPHTLAAGLGTSNWQGGHSPKRRSAQG